MAEYPLCTFNYRTVWNTLPVMTKLHTPTPDGETLCVLWHTQQETLNHPDSQKSPANAKQALQIPATGLTAMFWRCVNDLALSLLLF